jgi:hypothetical protein
MGFTFLTFGGLSLGSVDFGGSTEIVEWECPFYYCNLMEIWFLISGFL